MTARAKKPAEPVLVTDWYGHDVKPVHVGVYERDIIGLEGPHYSYWDGKTWSAFMQTIAEAFSLKHVPSLYQQYQWRGRRMWVLVEERNPLVSSITSETIKSYLVSARPRCSKFGPLESARPFKTERAAQRFAARYSHLGLTAVLP